MKFASELKHAFVMILVAVLTPASCLAAEPALVSKITGKSVTLTRAGKTTLPKVQTLLDAGDRISAGAGSTVEIQYLEDSCKLRLSDGHSVVIGSVSPCAEASASVPKKADDAASADQQAAEPASVKVEPAATNEEPVKITAKKGAFTRVNKGDGLIDADIGAGLSEGDEVFAGPNSSVTLYFKVPNCEYTVEAQTVYKVTSEPPCKAPAEPPSGSAGAVPPAVIAVLPPAFIAGGIGIVVAGKGKGKDKDKPVTPD